MAAAANTRTDLRQLDAADILAPMMSARRPDLIKVAARVAATALQRQLLILTERSTAVRNIDRLERRSSVWPRRAGSCCRPREPPLLGDFNDDTDRVGLSWC